ncbi:MAG: lipid II flippase MurJ, partial [Candidatus Zixiibacteriota bacterium]
ALVSITTWTLIPTITGLLGDDLPSESVAYVSSIARTFCLLIPLRALEALFRSILHIRNHFFLPALAPLVFNIVAITTLVTFFPSFDSAAFIVAWVLGMFVQTMMTLVPVAVMSWHDGKSSQTPFDRSEYLGFLSIVIFIESVGLLLEPLDRFMAGMFLSTGFVSAVNYAAVIYFLPVRVAVNSVATAIFPAFARLALSGSREGMATMYHRTVAACTFTLIPASVLLFMHRTEVIRLLLERGRFDAISTALTSEILAWFIPATLFVALSTFQWRLLYALKAWRYFATVRFLAILLKAGFGLWFIQSQWAMAIGLGTTLHFLLSFIALEWYLITKHDIRYSVADRKLIHRALVGAVAVSFAGALTTLLCRLAVDCTQFVSLIVTGVVSLSTGLGIDYYWNLTALDMRKITGQLRR